MSSTTPTAVPVTDVDRALAEKAVPKVFKRLLPFLILMYIIAFLDRSNLGFAQNEFKADLGISTAAYTLGATLFFIGYAVFEIPSNLFMHRVGAKFWMARIMVTWGIVAAAMAWVNSEWSLYVVRVLLGIAEAGFFPGVILFLTYWVPKQHMNKARGFFYWGFPLASILGAPLSGLIKDLFHGIGGFKGWQWMFVIEGLIAVVVGVWSYFYLTDKPRDAKWLADDEREALAKVMDAEDVEKAQNSPHSWAAALGNGKVWYFALIYFTIQAAVYGLTFFLPTQVGVITGEKVGLKVGLVTAIPWLAALICVILVARYADRTRKYVPLGMAMLAMSALGIAGSAMTKHPVLALISLCLAAMGFVSVQAFYWALPTEYLSGAAAAAGIGMINALGNCGGFVAPNVRTWVTDAVGNPTAGMYALAAFPLLGALFFGGVKFLFRTRDETRLDETA